MVRVLKTFWRVIVAIGLLLGIFWMPKDIQDSAQALGPWQDIFAMVDQLLAFKIFAGVLLLWLVWVDGRSYFYQWQEKRWPSAPAAPKLSLQAVLPQGSLDGGLMTVGVEVTNKGITGTVFAELEPVSGLYYNGLFSQSSSCVGFWKVAFAINNR